MCWGSVSRAGCAIFTYSRESFRCSHWCEWVTLASTLNTVAMNFFRLPSLLIMIMSLFTVNCCSSTCVIYKENSYQPAHSPLKPFYWFAREMLSLLTQSTWYNGKTTETSCEPNIIVAIHSIFVVTPGWTWAPRSHSDLYMVFIISFWFSAWIYGSESPRWDSSCGSLQTSTFCWRSVWRSHGKFDSPDHNRPSDPGITEVPCGFKLNSQWWFLVLFVFMGFVVSDCSRLAVVTNYGGTCALTTIDHLNIILILLILAERCLHVSGWHLLKGVYMCQDDTCEIISQPDHPIKGYDQKSECSLLDEAH